jgi:hypothetical protein
MIILFFKRKGFHFELQIIHQASIHGCILENFILLEYRMKYFTGSLPNGRSIDSNYTADHRLIIDR